MSYLYIIYSLSIDKYYIGISHTTVDDRLIRHNQGHYGQSNFTSQASDWKVFLEIEVNDYAHAVRLERKIKKMKSRIYLENLQRYKEMRERIISETSS